MLSKKQSHQFLFIALTSFTSLFQISQGQDTMNPPPPPPQYGSAPMSPVMEPTTTPYGTVGMTEVISAEPVGEGRLSMQLRGNFYQQAHAQPGAPGKDAQITTATFGAALGLNPYIDGFLGLGAYNLRGGGGPTGSGAGSTFLGAQGSLPLPQDLPIRLGLQIASIFGTAGSQINTTATTTASPGFYGYNYLETRKYTDLLARLTQSLIFAGDEMGVKFHFNEGIVSSFQPNKDVLLVTGAGMQFIVTPPIVLGIEINDRTNLKKVADTDPLWVTPSVVFRTPAHLNVEGGADISLAKDRYDGVRTLEPWRAFVGVSLAYDTQADKKRRNAEEAAREAEEKRQLLVKANRAEMGKDSLARLNESERARQQAIADSIAAKAKQDSINLASNLANAQSNLANAQTNLDATQRALQEERSKRSEAEKQLLSTGLLLLDAVYFQTGKTEISINSKPYLNIIAKMLTKYPKLQIEVAGHTDNVGGLEYNMGLSQGRSEAVMRYMVTAEPSLQGHLTAHGYGYSRPKASNATAEGRKFNRRTELEVTNKEVLKEYNP